MKPFIISFMAGALVGVLYSLLHVRSPAPPLVALAGLLGMGVAEDASPRLMGAISALLAT